jgi:hypothetical protein
MTGGLVRVPNGDSENWQKTIGAHNIWGSAFIEVINGIFTMTITIHEVDRYNFNKGMFDIASGEPDDENGRFAVLGWAKSFITKGELVVTVTWKQGNIENSSIIGETGGR